VPLVINSQSPLQHRVKDDDYLILQGAGGGVKTKRGLTKGPRFKQKCPGFIQGAMETFGEVESMGVLQFGFGPRAARHCGKSQILNDLLYPVVEPEPTESASVGRAAGTQKSTPQKSSASRLSM